MAGLIYTLLASTVLITIILLLDARRFKMSRKPQTVVTTVDYGSIPKGSIFDGVWGINREGVECWLGKWQSRAGTCNIMVPCDVCKEHVPQDLDLFAAAKRVLSANEERELERMERQQLAYLKAKYENVKGQQ